jgi:acyl dehydratase
MSNTTSDIIVDATPEAKAAFFSELQTYVGLEIGAPTPAPDEINAPMIRHLVEAVGDKNPIYSNSELAKQSIHGGIVAPPTMLQAWVMNGIEGPPRTGDGPYEKMNQLLFSRGFTSVVGTNSEQTYVRYLHPGDQLTMRTVIDSISDEKTTGLGTGHFVSTRQDYYDAKK